MGVSAGRSGHRWRLLVAEIKSARRPCYLCGQAIDYTVTYPHPEAFTVDHIQSWIGHPELREDPANLAACHARCNAVKGKAATPLSLGFRSEEW